MLLCKFFEEEIQDIAFLMIALHILHDARLQAFLASSNVWIFVKVHVCIFLDRIDHCKTLKRLGEIDLKIAIMNVSS